MKKQTQPSASGQQNAVKQPVADKATNKQSDDNQPADNGKEISLDLPEVKDIPGQEHIRPPRLKGLSDTTISSADEEGEGLFDDEADEDLLADKASNVSAQERELLDEAGYTDEDDAQLRAARLDSVDEDGEPLNEKGFEEDMSGDDLDVPGSEEDDANEELGEEDEENNAYSVDEENEDEKES